MSREESDDVWRWLRTSSYNSNTNPLELIFVRTKEEFFVPRNTNNKEYCCWVL